MPKGNATAQRMDLVVEDRRGNRWGVRENRGLHFYVRTPRGDRWIPMTKEDIVMSIRTSFIKEAPPALRERLMRAFGRSKPRNIPRNGTRSRGTPKSLLGAAVRRDK